MDRFSRALAALAVTTVVGAGVAACSTGDDGPAGVSPSTSGTTSPATPATTAPPRAPVSSTPVPGPAGGEVALPAPVADRWAELGGEAGALGRVTGPATDVAGGSVTDFERGTVVLTPAGRAFVVQGEILSAYREAGGPAGALGFPTADEATTDGGWISTFDGGTITFIDGRPAVELR